MSGICRENWSRVALVVAAVVVVSLAASASLAVGATLFGGGPDGETRSGEGGSTWHHAGNSDAADGHAPALHVVDLDRDGDSTTTDLDGLFGGDDGGVDVPVPIVFGATRVGSPAVLEHDTREAIYEAVQESPGVYLSKLADRTGEHVSTVRYHCRVLVSDGLVERRDVDGFHRLFPAAAAPGDDGTAEPDLTMRSASGTQREVLATVHRSEPVSVSALAGRLDLADSTVSYHLDRLEDDDVVERRRDGRSVRVRIAPSRRGAVEDLVEA